MRARKVASTIVATAAGAIALVLLSASPAGATHYAAHRDCDGNVTFESSAVGVNTHASYTALGVSWEAGPGESTTVTLPPVDGDTVTVTSTFTLDGVSWTEQHEVAIGPPAEDCTPPTTAPPTTAPPTTVVQPASQSATWAVDPFCRNDTPYLAVTALLPTELAGQPVTLHWVDSAGNERLSQRVPAGTSEVLWPGAELNTLGNPSDWPGWVLRGDEWFEADDGFLWARSASVFFTVNPTSPTFAATYPPATPTCNPNPPKIEILRSQETPPQTLPSTGGGAGPLAAAGIGLFAAGITLVVLTRKRAGTPQA
jgi:hypothetical protein